MTNQPQLSAKTESASPRGDASRSVEIDELLRAVQRSLDAGSPAKGIELIHRAKLTSPWAKNALAVCQLRLGNAKSALELLRGMVLASGGIQLRGDIPTVFKTNFAVALLLTDNVGGCLSTLGEIRENDYPAVVRLRGAIAEWRKSFGLLQTLNWYLGVPPDGPVPLRFPPGDLE